MAIAGARTATWAARSAVGRSTASDAAVVALVRAGDEAAFELLHARHHAAALAAARGVLGADRDAAEDAVQEAFLALWSRIVRFDPARGSVRAWLCSIARYRAIDLLRREAAEQQRRARAGDLDGTAAFAPAVDVVERSERARALRRAVDSLPGEQCRVMELAYYRGLSQSTIARMLGCPLGTVKGRSRLGVAKLREQLRDAA